MAKGAGRLCVLKKATVAIAGARVVGITWNGQPIDVTDQGDSGVQTFLADVLASDTLEISIEGVEEDQVIHDIAFSTTNAARFLTDLTFTFPNGDVISGSFVLTAYTETGNYQEAQTFSATFVRNGIHAIA